MKTPVGRFCFVRRQRWVSVFLGIALIFLSIIPVSAEDIVYRNTGVTGKKIALTFDDGPHPTQTTEILEILREYGVHATFFVIGCNVKHYPKQIPAILADGHEIGNHTYSHCMVSKASPETIDIEISRCEEAVYEVSEYRPKLFRPPGGSFGRAASDFCQKEEYSVVLWSIDTRDWTHREPAVIIKEVLQSVKPGDIILMHDYIGGYTPTPEVLRTLIPKLLNEGFEFCTVSELMALQ